MNAPAAESLAALARRTRKSIAYPLLDLSLNPGGMGAPPVARKALAFLCAEGNAGTEATPSAPINTPTESAHAAILVPASRPRTTRSYPNRPVPQAER